MKIKLNLKQIEDIRRKLEETDRKKFDIADISHVFRMLQYWSKCVGGKETKIKSVTALPDGYLCRVNSSFREAMKGYLKQARSGEIDEEGMDETEKGGMLTNTARYERLIKEAEEKQVHRKWES